MPEQQPATTAQTTHVERHAPSAADCEPVPSCWIYLSQDLPFPLRGKYTSVGLNAPDLVAQIDEVARRGHNEMIPLTLLVETKEMPVWITREHIVAVT